MTRSTTDGVRMRGGHLAALKAALDRLYDQFNDPDAASDPVQFVRRFTDPSDREIVAFLASGLAFGRVASVLASIEAVLGVMGDRPREYVRRFDVRRNAPALQPLVHRWTRGVDLSALMLVLQEMCARSGSVERFFAERDDPVSSDVTPGLEAFSRRACEVDVGRAYGGRTGRLGVHYFFPRPSSGSACKRLNLFLRWMVRHDRVDPGGWSAVAPARLVVPLDTHVIRVGQCLGLTRYRSAGWKMAREITETLRALDPSDPVRYDFSICHLGMMDACGFRRAQRDERCPLRGVCRPAGAGTRRGSRSPCAPR